MGRFIEDIKKYRSYALYAAKSELKSEVAGSHLSWLWWILDPMLFMMVYTFVHLVVFNKSEPYLPVFIFVGYSVWNFFSSCVRQSVKLVAANSSIVTKVYIPKYVLIFVKMVSNAFKMFISFILVAVLMIAYRIAVDWRIILLIPLFCILFVITFAFSSLLLHFGVYLEDLAYMISVALKLIFYMTGIFYNIEKRVPYPYSSILIKCNPMALLVSSLRKVLIYHTTPDWGALIVWLAVGTLLAMIGIHNIYKHENSYVKVMQ